MKFYCVFVGFVVAGRKDGSKSSSLATYQGGKAGAYPGGCGPSAKKFEPQRKHVSKFLKVVQTLLGMTMREGGCHLRLKLRNVD